MKIYGKLQLTDCFVYLPYRIISRRLGMLPGTNFRPAVLPGKASGVYNSMFNETPKHLSARTVTQNEESYPLKPAGHIHFEKSWAK
jgi:hypothetical protein